MTTTTNRRARRACSALLAVLSGSLLAAGAGAGPARAAEHSQVPLYYQQLNNDCEASALRMMLAAHGIQADDQAILKHIGVDLVHNRFGRSGPNSGDPYRAFVGDPNGSESDGTGYGVYYPR